MLVLGTLVPGDDTPEPQGVDGPRMVARGQGVVAHTRAGAQVSLRASFLGAASTHPIPCPPKVCGCSPADERSERRPLCCTQSLSCPATAVVRAACGGARVWGQVSAGFCLLSP